VHDPAGRLLLIKRANEPGRGLWSLPGGRVERDETDNKAVSRELLEETGLEVIPDTLVGMVLRGPYAIYDYECTVAGGTLRAGDDAVDARWVDNAAFTELEEAGALTDGLMMTLSDWNALPRA
jgi:ADP-ribose pyrophosphatase YjhB (NUDIX family)